VIQAEYVELGRSDQEEVLESFQQEIIPKEVTDLLDNHKPDERRIGAAFLRHWTSWLETQEIEEEGDDE